MKFVFDLDGTITRTETLPVIAKTFDVSHEIEQLTQNTVQGNIPFVESFIRRVSILGKYSVTQTRDVLSSIDTFADIVAFIERNSDDCIIATGNLDVWVSDLCDRIDCQYYASQAMVQDDKVVKISKILRKDEIVRQLQAAGEEVVYIGDGNNDAEAMRIANYAIASGLVHWPARSVLDVSDCAVFDETALVNLLEQIQTPQTKNDQSSLVLSCAGIGSRLGLSSTKALISLEGKPQIQWQLEHFKEIEDMRVVVGFEADRVIEAVLEMRQDVIFVFNHDYFTTGTGHSLYLGSRFSNGYVIAWDGDLVVHHEDIAKCLYGDGEYLCVSTVISDDAVYAELTPDNQSVSAFSRENKTPYEWSGPAKLRSTRIPQLRANVFESLIEHLPLPAKTIRAFDIDTPDDYAFALENFRSFTSG